MKDIISQEFSNRFGYPSEYVIRAPGRVNLIGEHTDYNDGFVLPMTIDRSIWMAVNKRDDQKVVLHSMDFDEHLDLLLDDIRTVDNWGNYVTGVAWALNQAGYELKGWEGVLLSEIPKGAGLSSSAALEMAVAKTFSEIGGWPFDPPKMAKIGQRAENEWVGANTGIMDQTIVASGKTGHALMLDCRNQSTKYVPLPEGYSVVIMDSATRHTHTDSGYNDRRAQCEEAAQFFEVSPLRDVSTDEFYSKSDELEELPRLRAKHVITENARVLRAVTALSAGDVNSMGGLMAESHVSMRDDFEITNKEIDILANIAQSHVGCPGARMTGGGFGGCVIAFVKDVDINDFIESVEKSYKKKTGIDPEVFSVRAVDGVESFPSCGTV